MRTAHDYVVAASCSVDPAQWREIFDALMARVTGRFTRMEPRRRARAFVLGLLSDLPARTAATNRLPQLSAYA